MVKKIPVQPIKVCLYCDVCKEEMEAEDGYLASNPPKYRHYCGCGVSKTMDKKYPYFEYEEIKKEVGTK